MKTLMRVAFCVLGLALVVSLPTGSALAAKARVIKLGTTVNEQDSFQVAGLKFAELVKERTDGAYIVEIYPNAALGDERTMLEGMQMGTMDMGIITSGPFVNFVPEFGLLDLPFLFADNAHAYAVLDGEIGQSILAKLEGVGIQGLAYAERGFRNLSNSVRPVVKAEDLKGLKIRVMENEVYTNTFKELGTNAVPMAWTETLTALQQGAIDGQENPVNVIHSFKLWESQKYVTMTRHAYAAALFVMSDRLYKKLPAEVQKIVREAAQEAAVYERQWVADNEARQMAELKEKGMEIIEEPDMASFRAGVQGVYAKYPQFTADLERIQAARP